MTANYSYIYGPIVLKPVSKYFLFLADGDKVFFFHEFEDKKCVCVCVCVCV